MALESAASNKEIFDVMRVGRDALKVANANMYELDQSQNKDHDRMHAGKIGLSSLLQHVSLPLSLSFFSPCRDVDKVADVMEDMAEIVRSTRDTHGTAQKEKTGRRNIHVL